MATVTRNIIAATCAAAGLFVSLPASRAVSESESSYRLDAKAVACLRANLNLIEGSQSALLVLDLSKCPPRIVASPGAALSLQDSAVPGERMGSEVVDYDNILFIPAAQNQCYIEHIKNAKYPASGYIKIDFSDCGDVSR